MSLDIRSNFNDSFIKILRYIVVFNKFFLRRRLEISSCLQESLNYILLVEVYKS